MAVDLIARLIANTSGYDPKLAKSLKTTQDFMHSNLTLNGVMAQGLTALTKLGAGFGAVALATKAFNTVIMEGSQTTGDFVRNGIGAMNDTLGMLAQSLATCDFSAFNQGLITTFQNAVKLREELDALNDMTIAVNYLNTQSNRQLAEAMEVLKDPASSAEQISAAIESGDAAMAKISKTTKTFSNELERTAYNMVDLWSGVGGATREMIDDLENLQMNPERAADMKQYFKEVSSTMPKESAYRHKQGSGKYARYVTDNDSYQRDLEAWQKNYLNVYAQIGKTFLEKNDEDRKKMLDYLTQADEEAYKVAKMGQRWGRAKNTALNGGKSTSSGISSASIGKAAVGVTSQMEIKDVSMPNPFATTESKKSLQDNIVKIQAQLDLATDPVTAGKLEKMLEDYQKRLDVQPLALRLGISTEAALDMQSDFQDLATSIQSSMQESLEDMTGWLNDAAGSSKKVSKEGKENKDAWKQAAASVSQLGSALQGVDNKGVNIAGIIMEAVANVALGFAQALASPASGAAGVFGWIAAAVSGLATMTATIVSIKKATSGSYAEGGIVPGSYNGGVDNTYVYASPGEVILNRAQQQNLLAQLDNGSSAGGVRTVVRGEQIVTALNSYGRRKGYGEVAWQ